MVSREWHSQNTGQFQLNHDLNELPFVDRELSFWQLYGEPLYKREPFTYTMVGRDCPWAKCTFCSWTTLFPKFRTCTPERLLDEIGMLIDRYGIREIFDDTGSFPSGGWLDKFCKGMIERGYNKKKSEFPSISGSIISTRNGQNSCASRIPSHETRTRIRKSGNARPSQKGHQSRGHRIRVQGCKEAGLEVHLTIMVGYPWETKKDAPADTRPCETAYEKRLCGHASIDNRRSLSRNTRSMNRRWKTAG